MSTAGTWPTSTFILPYPRQFNVLPSAVRTHADFCFQKRHTALLTNFCEHPESINAVHSCPSTCTFMERSSIVFSRSGRRLMLMPPPLWRFPWHCDAICPRPPHLKQRISRQTLRIRQYGLSWRSCKQSFTCGWDHHTCSRQIFYHNWEPLILKMFVWRRRWPILRGLRCQSWQLSPGSIAVSHSSFPSRMRHGVDVWRFVVVQKRLHTLTNVRAAVPQPTGPVVTGQQKNSTTVSSGWSCRVTNWSYALNASVAYAVMRACLICSASAFCSTLSCLYIAKAPPRNLNGKMRSTFFIVQSSLTSSTFSTYSTMGISVAAPLNSGISWTSNILPFIAKR